MRLTPRFSLPAVLLSGALITFSTTSRSDAASIFAYVAGAPAFTAASAGSVVAVPVYLEETYTGSSLLASEEGLDSAGLDINLTAGNGTISGLTLNPAFGGVTQSTVGTAATAFTEAVANTATTGVAATTSGTMMDEVLLGTVDVTAGSTPSTFTLEAFRNPAFGNTPAGSVGGNTLTFANFDDLDMTSVTPTYTAAAPTTFTVAVTPVTVPEPVSATIVGGLMVLGLGGRRRRSVAC